MPTARWISQPKQSGILATSTIRRFYSSQRELALEIFNYQPNAERRFGFRVAKVDSALASGILSKISGQTTTTSLVVNNPKWRVFYQEACRYWAKSSSFSPRFIRNGIAVEQPHGRIISLSSELAAGFLNSLLNSSLFYWYYSTLSDCEHVNDSLIKSFPLPSKWSEIDWISISNSIDKFLTTSANAKIIRTKQGHVVEYDEINGKSAREQIYFADEALGNIFGMSSEELDYIINYDIKYRMGLNGGEADADE
jgi:hypothetical protein